MLVELVIENFYSFRDETAFSMVASTIPEHPETVADSDGLTLCKVSTIYGANASGKSNLLKALAVIKEGLFVAKGDEKQWLTKIKPFHLDVASEEEDTLLEVSFMLDEQLYRYGFFSNRETITEEYLYQDETTCFLRTAEGVEGEWGCNNSAPDRLLLADQLSQHPKLQAWFHHMRIILDTKNVALSISMAKLHLKKYKHNLLTLIQVADPSIHDVKIRESNEGQDEFYVIKLKKQGDGRFEPIHEGFLFQDVESDGTVKLLALAGPIIEALESGGLLMIDEMDQSFHTLMTRYVLELFRGEFNEKGAQLVYSTHDVSNLSSDIFRRDQVWFVEKRQEGNSELVSLVEFQFEESERKNSFNFYRNYLNGKYGAVPHVPPADWWVDDGEE